MSKESKKDLLGALDTKPCENTGPVASESIADAMKNGRLGTAERANLVEALDMLEACGIDMPDGACMHMSAMTLRWVDEKYEAVYTAGERPSLTISAAFDSCRDAVNAMAAMMKVVDQ